VEKYQINRKIELLCELIDEDPKLARSLAQSIQTRGLWPHSTARTRGRRIHRLPPNRRGGLASSSAPY